MTEPGASPSQFSPRTVWARRLETPLRRFLRTETGGAAVLLAATLAALAWANIDASGYAAAWHTVLMIRSGTRGLADSWQGWVNSGLMAFFFLVAGLEARREFDLGELRERRRVALPLVVALGGMVVPIAIYLAINFGRSSASGWGTAMSTDTAFALGALALVGSGVPDRVRTYLLTFALADDVAGSWSSRWPTAAHRPDRAGGGRCHPRRGDGGALAGCPQWPGLPAAGGGGLGRVLRAGVDPVVVGLAMGLLAVAYPTAPRDLKQASESPRLFREQPDPELARDARESVGWRPVDDQLQNCRSLDSYLMVPLFAWRTRDHGSGSFLAHAYTSPVTLGSCSAMWWEPAGTVGRPGAARASRGAIRPGRLGSGDRAGRRGMASSCRC